MEDFSPAPVPNAFPLAGRRLGSMPSAQGPVWVTVPGKAPSTDTATAGDGSRDKAAGGEGSPLQTGTWLSLTVAVVFGGYWVTLAPSIAGGDR
jgi:hypothetical protein